MTLIERWTTLLAGFLAAGYAVAALYFFKFWTRTRDRLFLFFGLAFTLLVIQRVALNITAGSETETIWYYVIRLVAFLLILWAIVDKNRR